MYDVFSTEKSFHSCFTQSHLLNASLWLSLTNERKATIRKMEVTAPQKIKIHQNYDSAALFLFCTGLTPFGESFRQSIVDITAAMLWWNLLQVCLQILASQSKCMLSQRRLTATNNALESSLMLWAQLIKFITIYFLLFPIVQFAFLPFFIFIYCFYF